MTVGELIEKLQQLPSNVRVFVHGVREAVGADYIPVWSGRENAWKGTHSTENNDNERPPDEWVVHIL